MPRRTPMPQHIEVGAVLQHRPRGNSGDVGAPPHILVVGRDEELGRWLAVDHNWKLVSVWPSTEGMYNRLAPGHFKHRGTYLDSGARRWRHVLGPGRVSMRT